MRTSLEHTVDRFLAHKDSCVRCQNEPFNLCKTGELLLECIGIIMPTAPSIHIEVTYNPDRKALEAGHRPYATRDGQRRGSA